MLVKSDIKPITFLVVTNPDSTFKPETEVLSLEKSIFRILSSPSLRFKSVKYLLIYETNLLCVSYLFSKVKELHFPKLSVIIFSP